MPGVCLGKLPVVLSCCEVGRGQSQLVPRLAPQNPRLFTPRECARIMGFAESYQLGEGSRDRCQALYPLCLGSVYVISIHFMTFRCNESWNLSKWANYCSHSRQPRFSDSGLVNSMSENWFCNGYSVWLLAIFAWYQYLAIQFIMTTLKHLEGQPWYFLIKIS